MDDLTEETSYDDPDSPEEEPRLSVLTAFEIEPDLEPPSPEVESFLADADARIDGFFDRHRRDSRLGFFPSDHSLVYGVLRALRRMDDQARRFCEWGSGFGVIAGFAAFLGYEAYGIEIDPRLIALSRKLLARHQLAVEILEGNFIPDDYAKNERYSKGGGTTTILAGQAVYDAMDLEIEDFDVIFAFPWPDEQEMYCDLFARFADDGAVLVTYSALEQIRAYRKTGAPITDG